LDDDRKAEAVLPRLRSIFSELAAADHDDLQRLIARVQADELGSNVIARPAPRITEHEQDPAAAIRHQRFMPAVEIR
jgi:RNase P/RNase MRP subunit POP5